MSQEEKKKRRSKDSSLIEQRDSELFKAYENVIKKHGKYATLMPKKQLIKEAVESPTSQFFISTFTAKLIINKMLKRPSSKTVVLDENESSGYVKSYEKENYSK
jgi:hypothetical protein